MGLRNHKLTLSVLNIKQYSSYLCFVPLGGEGAPFGDTLTPGDPSGCLRSPLCTSVVSQHIGRKSVHQS